MEPTTGISPFVIADTYRVGQVDGFKAGLAVGVVTVVLAKAAFDNRKRKGGWFNRNPK